METLEYIAEILPDGHLSVPEAIIKKLNLKSHSKLDKANKNIIATNGFSKTIRKDVQSVR